MDVVLCWMCLARGDASPQHEPMATLQPNTKQQQERWLLRRQRQRPLVWRRRQQQRFVYPLCTHSHIGNRARRSIVHGTHAYMLHGTLAQWYTQHDRLPFVCVCVCMSMRPSDDDDVTHIWTEKPEQNQPPSRYICSVSFALSLMLNVKKWKE